MSLRRILAPSYRSGTPLFRAVKGGCSLPTAFLFPMDNLCLTPPVRPFFPPFGATSVAFPPAMEVVISPRYT